MIDIRLIRENPDLVRENIRKKFQDAKLPLVDEVIELDKANRAAINEASNLRAERNSLSKKIGMLMGQAKKDPSKLEEAEAVKAQVTAQAARLAELEKQEEELEAKIHKIMLTIPQIIDPSVPLVLCHQQAHGVFLLLLAGSKSRRDCVHYTTASLATPEAKREGGQLSPFSGVLGWSMGWVDGTGRGLCPLEALRVAAGDFHRQQGLGPAAA